MTASPDFRYIYINDLACTVFEIIFCYHLDYSLPYEKGICGSVATHNS
jgi:hypothetical protein